MSGNLKYDFSKISPDASITTEWILSKITDCDIFAFYHGSFKLGKTYTSNLRRDRNPSVAFYLSKFGRIRYKDYATGDNFNCFEYVQKLHNCTFREALYIIAKDFGLLTNVASIVPQKVFTEATKIDKELKKETIIQFTPDKWNTENLAFWKQYEITQEELEKESIFPIRHAWVNKYRIIEDSNKVSYAYLIKDEEEQKEYVKIYSPFDKQNKWVTNCPLTIPFGLNTFDRSSQNKLCIITKSMKDMIVLKKIFPSVIGVQNESEGSFPEELQKKLLKTFEKCIIVWDADPVGVENCRRMNSKGFGYWNVAKKEYLKYKIKDPADYVKWYSVELLKELFDKTLKI